MGIGSRLLGDLELHHALYCHALSSASQLLQTTGFHAQPTVHSHVIVRNVPAATFEAAR